MEASRQGLFSSRHFATSKSYRSKLAAIDQDIRKPIMTPSDIAARCVMGSIKSRFVHGTLRLVFTKPTEREKFRLATFPPGMDLPKPDCPY
jgi:hypothetical protein